MINGFHAHLRASTSGGTGSPVRGMYVRPRLACERNTVCHTCRHVMLAYRPLVPQSLVSRGMNFFPHRVSIKRCGVQRREVCGRDGITTARPLHDSMGLSTVDQYALPNDSVPSSEGQRLQPPPL